LFSIKIDYYSEVNVHKLDILNTSTGYKYDSNEGHRPSVSGMFSGVGVDDGVPKFSHNVPWDIEAGPLKISLGGAIDPKNGPSVRGKVSIRGVIFGGSGSVDLNLKDIIAFSNSDRKDLGLLFKNARFQVQLTAGPGIDEHKVKFATGVRITLSFTGQEMKDVFNYLEGASRAAADAMEVQRAMRHEQMGLPIPQPGPAPAQN